MSTASCAPAFRTTLPESIVQAIAWRARVHDPALLDALRGLSLDQARAWAGWQSGGPHAGGLPIGAAALMVSALELTSGARVLVLGAQLPLPIWLLARLASQVYVVDVDSGALNAAMDAVDSPRVIGHVGALSAGWPGASLFDAILMPVAGEAISEAHAQQLRPGGVLVTLTPGPRLDQRIVALRRTPEGSFEESLVGNVGSTALFGEVTTLLGAAHESEVWDALQQSLAEGRPIGELLQASGLVDPQELVRILATQRGIGLASVDALLALRRQGSPVVTPRGYVETNRAIPLSISGAVLSVATTDETFNPWDLQRASRAQRVDVYLVTETDFRRLLSAIDLGMELPEPASTVPEPDTLAATAVADAADSRWLQLFESILLDAMGERASDIHLERYGSRVRVRLRVDGDLQDVGRYTLSVDDLLGLVNVIKIQTGLDIAERRRPQGGRLRRVLGRQAVDMRVQTQPSLHGEHVVIRLLVQQTESLEMETLGFSAPVARAIRRLIDSPAGLVLVVGPTGSGKTTTLYSALQLLRQDPTRKVITVEDPIEYSLEGIQQTQVHPEVNFHFADAMRSFVRQDPDVILVGEIRDGEAGLEAMRASQTGHLVLTTLHCNDAVDAVQRLRDLGLQPNTIAAELLAVVAQRLARRNCEGCLQPAKPDAALLAEVFPGGAPADFACWRGVGCTRCNGRGTRGRVAVAEFLQADPALRRAISLQRSPDELRTIALGSGMVTLRDSALELIARGWIPFEEMRSLLIPERLAPERDPRTSQSVH